MAGSDLFSLEGRNAVITGGGGDIGGAMPTPGRARSRDRGASGPQSRRHGRRCRQHQGG